MNLLQIHEPGETPLPHQNNAAIGIDLGTTHCVIAISSGGKVEVLRDICGGVLIPSVVHYAASGEIEVGKAARSRFAGGQGDTIASIKRLMGRGGESLPAGRKQRTPVEISADILTYLKQVAEQAVGKEITQAVITVPAYFDDAARQATKDAARLSGLEVLRLVNEPTAAALAYGLDSGAEGIYGIYDLGGGTFDISLLKLEKGVFQVLSTAGDTALGGDDFDAAIATHWAKKHNITTGEGEWNILLSKARGAKEMLSEQDSAHCNVSLSGTTYECSLNRKEFEQLIRSDIERSIAICKQAVADARLSVAEINGVVLVGGSTRIPLVKQQVEKLFGKVPLADVNPDEVVAIGAALQAEALTTGSDTLLLDVIPLSLGLETMGNIVEKIIHRNTPIPVAVSQEFTTYKDGQTGMVVHVLQGEREMVKDCRSLGRFELSGIPPMVAGMARIKVTFTVDADGLLTVSAREETTGKEQSVAIKPSYGLAPEQIESMLLESMQHAKEDILQRLLAEARMEAERSLLELESAMRQDGDLLSEEEVKAFPLHISMLRAAIAGEDRDAIDRQVQEFHAITRAFAERRMDKAITSALKGTNVTSY